MAVSIQIQNLVKRFGATTALDHVTLDIRPGEFVCILGGNGSGKSTLAKHVNALLVPDEGAVCVLGADTADPAQTFFVRSHAGSNASSGSSCLSQICEKE